MKKIFLAAFFLFFSLSSVTYAASNVPTQVGDIYVQDFANLIDSRAEQEIIKLGESLDKKHSAQISILTVKSIGNSTIEDYSLEAFRKYKLGNKEENNGILLVLAEKEKNVRIEVGYGLEGVINDGKAGSIIDQITIPHLKKGNTSLALYETYRTLNNEVNKYYENDSVSSDNSSESSFSLFNILLIIIILIIAVILDIYIFGGWLTYLILSIITNSDSGSSGGGGDSGGGGSSRDW